MVMVVLGFTEYYIIPDWRIEKREKGKGILPGGGVPL